MAQTCAAPGKDGPATISGTVNTHYSPNSNATFTPATTVIGLTSRAGNPQLLTPGDMVMVMQMQCETINTTNTNNYGAGNGTGRGYTDPAGTCLAGRYEYVRAGPATTDTSLDISGSPLSDTYIQDPSTAPNRRTFQLIRVPQYSSVALNGTLTAITWNGNVGGVVAFDSASNTNWNGGTIDVSSLGFRGAGGLVWNNTAPNATDYSVPLNTPTAGTYLHASKGEGIAGTPRYVYNDTSNTVQDLGATWGGYAGGDLGRGSPGNAGGGGGNFNGARDNGGGGGGGNGGQGGIGGWGWKGSAWIAGYAGEQDLRGIGAVNFAQAAFGRLVMGGGGGASGNNNSTPLDSSGGQGGGIALIRTGSASGVGTIRAFGGPGNTAAANDGSGGGGAGGSVVVFSANNTMGALTVNAQGGAGGNSFVTGTVAHGPGGGGGGGVVLTSGAVTANTNGGANGITNTGDNPPGGPAHGATPGTSGTITFSASLPPATGVGTGAQCLPVINVAKSTTTPIVTLPAGTTAQYVIRVSNAATAGTAYGLSVVDILPAPFGLAAVASTASVTFSVGSAGPAPTTANQSGNTNTAVWGAGGGFPTNSFTLSPGGALTLTFTVNINTTTIVQTFQNAASATFTDPTRTTGGAAAAGGNPVVTPGGVYASGAAVSGANYATNTSANEDVRLVGSVNLSITKTNNETTLTSGQTTSYTVTAANGTPSLGLLNAVITDTPSAGLSCSAATCSATGGATCPAPYNPGPASIASLQAGLTVPLFPANSTLSFVVTCSVTATGL